jgi:hypothetical protein
MALADLKKNATRSNPDKQFQVSADDFIEEANLYAMGKSSQATPDNVICFKERQAQNEPTLILATPIAERPKIQARRPREQGPFRKATFTLTESAWQHLALLASATTTAKSRLIRNMIEKDYDLTKTQTNKD